MKIILYSMKPPIFVHPLSDAERKSLKAGLRSPDAFTPCAATRSCWLGCRWSKPLPDRARNLCSNPHTVRNVVHKFNEKGP